MSGKQNMSREDRETETGQEIQGSDTGQEQPDTAIVEVSKNGAGEVEPTIESLSQELEIQKQAVEENLDKALRAQAEMDNLRKRTIRDIENAHKYALEKFVSELVPVIDSMELGISAVQNAENIGDLRDGMDLTLKMLVTCMDKFGIRVIDPQGEKFNPEQHQAIFMHEVEGADAGTVTTVVQKGYELNGRLVRPAMVIVAK